MQSVRRAFGFALLALLFIAGTLPARGSVVFNYSATCTIDCAAIGLAAGDTVRARFAFADASVVPGGVVDLGDVESFSATFGSATFGLPHLTFFEGELDATAASLTAFIAFGVSADAGFLLANDGASINFFLVQTAAGIAEGARGSILRAPEPGTAALVGIALLVAAGVRRSRTRR